MSSSRWKKPIALFSEFVTLLPTVHDQAVRKDCPYDEWELSMTKLWRNFEKIPRKIIKNINIKKIKHSHSVYVQEFVDI